MKRIFITLMVMLATLPMLAQAQGWPTNYGGVMLQGFYWDSYDASRWTKLEAQADELARSFDIIWIPQSADCGGTSMGYDDLYWFPGHYNSSFGTEAELRSMIKTFKAKGLKTLADVVINHRRNVSNWVDFPAETYKGVTYQLKSTDICANDDGGAAKTEAAKLGLSVSTNNDTGEGWDGMRDLDHNSANVQTNVKAYLKMLLEDLGYAGFRYDMVKGYSGSFTKQYNNDAMPEFSVGECWDGSSTISSWIDATDKTSAAFDFHFKYVVKNAANDQNWSKLNQQNDGNWPLVYSNYSSGNYRRYAVTFVENHDTELRPDGSSNGPLQKDTLAANAFLLAMPGTPCVFYKHWLTYKTDISAMIAVRKACNILNISNYTFNEKTANRLVGTVTGNGTRMRFAVGKTASSYTASGYTKVLEGYHYAYFMYNSMNTAWADKASGEYDRKLQVMLSAVTSPSSGAKLVYTLDGSEPTASSTQVASGTKINIDGGTVTLKVGLLINGVVSGVVTRQYVVNPFDPYTFTVYVNTDKVGWNPCNFWSWGGDGTHAPKKSQWPGDAVTSTTTIGGRKWFTHEYTINSASDEVNFVFSTGTGTPQTVNVEGITQDIYCEVLSDKSGDNHLVSVSTEAPTLLMGDVNGDGVINTTDAVIIAGYMVGKAPEGFSDAAADLNGDGKIDVSDILKLVGTILGQ